MNGNIMDSELGYFGEDIDTKFGVVSLVGFLTMQARKKSPMATCEQVIKKIAPDLPDDQAARLGYVCEEFMYGVKKFNLCGLKTAKEMTGFIKDALDKWLPF